MTINGIDLVVRRDDPRVCELREVAVEEPRDGQALCKIQRFAITANNVTYATTGDVLGYWQFYPVDSTWGRVPAWGFAEVVASRSDLLDEGDRLYGFWPMSSHATIEPTGRKGSRLIDTTPHRVPLPALYNAYLPAGAEDPQREELESLLRPLFGTAWLIADSLEQEGFHNAATVVLSSASSKTAAATAWCLSQYEHRPHIVGLTSARNQEFVASLAGYDETVTYDELTSAPITTPVAFVDVAGSAAVRGSVHRHFGTDLAYSLIVGGTHWENSGGWSGSADLPGPTAQMFFAPTQSVKRAEELGRGEFVRLVSTAQAEYTDVYAKTTEMRLASTADAVVQAWIDQVNGETKAATGIVATLSR
jgi:hypothetical protein